MPHKHRHSKQCARLDEFLALFGYKDEIAPTDMSDLASERNEGTGAPHHLLLTWITSVHVMVELLAQFFDEYRATTGEADTIDTDEVITAVAKTVAELTCSQNGTIRRQMIKKPILEIMEYDAEFRQEDKGGETGSAAWH